MDISVGNVNHQQSKPPTEDPFLAALEAAPWSVEPATNEEHTAFQEGWRDYLRGDSVSLEEYARNRPGRAEDDADPAR